MEKIKSDLQVAIKQLFDLGLIPTVTAANGQTAQDGSKVDYATNVAMQLAGQLHQSPQQLAQQIVANLADSTAYQAEVAGPGFINFILSDAYLTAKIRDFRANFTENISSDAYSGQTVICEFSDPNPFKVLHVGHLYTSVVGEAISKLIEQAGGQVIRANFGGDVGLHVAKTIWSILQHPDELAQVWNAPLSDRAEFMARCYVEGTRAYEDDPSAQATIAELNHDIYQYAAADPQTDWQPEYVGNAELYSAQNVAAVYWWGRSTSYDYFDDFYHQIGVQFDKYYPESTVADRGLQVVNEHPEVYVKSAGATVFKGEDYGLHTRVFINQAGLPTYETKDVGLLFTKWDDYHFDQSIVITGNDVTDYMKVVLTSVAQFAPELVEKSLHLTHGNVRLPGNQKMSSRKGNFLKAVEVLQLVADELQAQYHTTDPLIATAAYKYVFLKYKIGGNIEFDVQSSVSTSGNSGPYLQYSAVRARKVLAKVSAVTESSASDKPAPTDLHPSERALINKLLQYPATLHDATADFAPHKLCAYLYELAQDFSRFYETCPVAGSPQEASRAQLVATFLQVLTNGLHLLGIEVPTKM